MANTIRIKRSVSTNTPASLAQGELAYSESGSPNGIGELFIGVAGPGVQKLITLTGAAAAEPNDPAQDNQTITTGLGIDGADAGTTGNVTLSLATTELTNTAPVAADQFVFNDATDELPKKQVASSVPLSIFNNDSAWTSDVEAIHGNWNFSTTTTAADPGSGNLRFNSATPASVTAIYVDDLQNDTTSAGWLTDNIAIGDVLTIRAVGDPGDYLIAEVTSVTDNTGWWTYGVTILGSGTLPANAAAIQLDVQWLSQAPGTVTSVTASTGLVDTGTASAPIIAVDYAGTNNFIDSATNLEGTAIALGDTLAYHDATDNNVKKGFFSDLPFLTAEADTLATVTGRGATTSTASTFSGGLNMADSDLNRPVLEDYGVKHQAPTVSANAVTVDFTLGNSVLIDMDPATAAVTLTLSNPPASGTYGEVNLAIVMGTPAYGITWPGSVTWLNGGTAPTLTTTNNVVDLIHLFTVDGGTTYYGTYSLAAAAGGQANQTITTGLGIDGADAGSAGNITISLATTELTNTAPVAADQLVFNDGTDELPKKQAFSSVDLSLFSNTTSDFATVTYVDNAVTGALIYKGGYNAATNTPDLDVTPSGVVKGDTYTVTAAGNFFTEAVQVGDMLVAEVDSASTLADWTVVNKNIPDIVDASETAKGIIEIATQAEVDAASSTVLAVVPNYLHNTTFDGGTF